MKQPADSGPNRGSTEFLSASTFLGLYIVIRDEYSAKNGIKDSIKQLLGTFECLLGSWEGTFLLT